MIETDKNKLRISIQGIEGSFHQLAAEKYFNQKIGVVAGRTFYDVLASTTDSAICDHGIIAIENSIAGTILPNYNLIANSELYVVGEIFIKIEHYLMALPGARLSGIKEIHSHPMALLQCEDFLNHQNVSIIERDDTAGSARNIQTKKLKGVAAIASRLAADIYGLDIIASNIETAKNNFTRFLILSRDSNQAEWPLCNKASIRCSLPHTPGSLSKALELIASAGLNLSKIQSVPMVEKEWQYMFHLDIEFDTYENFEKSMRQIKNISTAFSVLGIYKKAQND